MVDSSRSYNCKDEELPVIAQYVSYSVNRDIADFTAFSPVFTPEYVTGFQGKITTVQQLVAPETETAELKALTTRLYATMKGLLPKLAKFEAYAKLAKADLGIALADFGLRNLRRAIQYRDAEGVLDRLNTFNSLIVQWGAPMIPVGFTAERAAEFTGAATSINADNQAQYEILSNRKAIVQANLGLLEDLYAQILDINRVGKALYRTTDPVKYEEYTFSKLKRKVRQVTSEPAGE